MKNLSVNLMKMWVFQCLDVCIFMVICVEG